MRVVITFGCERPFSLTAGYNEIIQGFIYRHLPHETSTFVHDRGYGDGTRKFKFFTFSRIQSDTLRYEKDRFTFGRKFSLVVSSMDAGFMEQLLDGMEKDTELSMQGFPLHIMRTDWYQQAPKGDEWCIEMLAPMTLYSTLMTSSGAKKAYYYSPFEREFTEQVHNNLARKYTAIFGKAWEGDVCSIAPNGVDVHRNHHVIKFKGGPVNAWDGSYTLSGPSELLEIAYFSGLGAKNSQGFGCFHVCSKGESAM